MVKIKKGKIYKFDHRSKGSFVGKVRDCNEVWSVIELIEGDIIGTLSYWGGEEVITIRNNLLLSCSEEVDIK